MAARGAGLLRWIVLVLGAVSACTRREPTPSAPVDAAAPVPSAARPRTPWTPAAIAHAGAGTPPRYSDGCRRAVDVALAALESGADPVDAAVAGVVVLEDDPRFNAGTGAAVRLDGVSVQMDASVMSSSGRFGAVANIENVKNPVKVARAVLDTPHLVLAGDGATRFARTLGMAPYDPTTPDRVARAHAVQAELARAAPSLPSAWRTFDWRTHWNFATPIADAGFPDAGPADAGHDTVGVAVRAADGRFAVALSTGGMALAMRGRVGDVPILGAGLFAGESGAAAATGTGERVIEAGLARSVHGWLAAGATATEAAKRAVDVIRGKGDIGIIVIAPTSLGAAADRDMAWAARESGSAEWSGPAPAKTE